MSREPSPWHPRSHNPSASCPTCRLCSRNTPSSTDYRPHHTRKRYCHPTARCPHGQAGSDRRSRSETGDKTHLRPLSYMKGCFALICFHAKPSPWHAVARLQACRGRLNCFLFIENILYDKYSGYNINCFKYNCNYNRLHNSLSIFP